MDAAVTLFAEKGVLGASVEEICEHAGFTRGAFYSNFVSKDDLCLAVLARQADEKLRAAQEATALVPDQLSGPDEIDALIESTIRIFLAVQPRDPAWLIAHSELRLHAVRTPATRESFLALNREMTELVGDVLASALARVGARLTLPMDQAIDLLYAVWEHGGTAALIHGREPDDDTHARQLAALLRSLVEPID